jgi:predicted GNAT superfamily acetyltransferase
MSETHPVSESDVRIRPVETVPEYRACQELQRRAWGIVEDGYVVPVATMISVQHAGGLVLGAFVPGEDGERLAGFAFGYLGRVRGRWALYSQLAAVDDTLRDLGIGGKLKHAQRAWAKQQGLSLVAWTFDPMQAGNANFNLHRLGAFCRTYYRDYFGERTDALNAGQDSDRLLAEWPVEDARSNWLHPDEPPKKYLFGIPSPIRNTLRNSLRAGKPLRLEVPADFARMKERDRGAASLWQHEVSSAFRLAFNHSYVAMDVEREGEGEQRRVFYVLRKPVDPEALIP